MLSAILRKGYPTSTIASVAAKCGEPVLTVKKWVDGTAEPSIVLAPLILEIITRDYRERRARRRRDRV